jgi:hypothetical protein
LLLKKADMEKNLSPPDLDPILSAEDLLAGSTIIHEIHIPPQILQPGSNAAPGAVSGNVLLRPLNVATLALISRAARDDAGLVPLLMIKESLAKPPMTLDRIRQLHVGLVHFLVGHINRISGLGGNGDALKSVIDTPIGQAHFLLAMHFGWTPEQVSRLTPGQVAVYLSGIEKLSQAGEKGQ